MKFTFMLYLVPYEYFTSDRPVVLPGWGGRLIRGKSI